MENMSYTSDGKLGFNHSTSEDLGNINAIAFKMRISLEDAVGAKLDGIARIRVGILDINENVGYYDFEVDFTNSQIEGSGTWQSVILPVSGFRPYRGRQPKSYFLRGLTLFDIEIPIDELDINEQIEFQHIKRITWQIQDMYDDDGRYNPEAEMLGVSNFGVSTASGGFMRMAIDAFHFRKTLLVMSGTDSVRNIEPDFLQRPNLISYKQLKKDVDAQLKIEEFPHHEFNFQTAGRKVFDVPFGDTVFLKNKDLIKSADKNETNLGDSDGEANTFRGVVKRIEYHLTKPTVGSGGLTRTMQIIKRFV